MLKLFKAKSLKNTNFLTSNRNERTQEKAILKEGIGTSREAFVSRGGRTRASLFGTYTPSKMGFAVRGSKKQRGRSMVEMLGVLAIIGVLSIGGISGYTLAMRRYRVNEILNFINRYAFDRYVSFEKSWDRYFEQTCKDTHPGWNCSAPFGDNGSQINHYLISYYQDTDTIADAPEELSEIGLSGIRIGTSYPDAIEITLSFKTLEMCNTFCSATNNDMCACEGDRTIPGEWYQSTYTGDMEYKEPITIKGRQAVSLLVIEE